MFGITKRLSTILAGGAVVAALCMPALAAGIGVGAGASVGGSGGVNAGAGASVGGGNGVNGGAGASIGGGTGANAGAGASIGGSGGGTAGLGATVGGQNGVGVGTGVAGIGGATPSSLSNSSLSGVVADMSDSQVARMKKRCADVLASSGSYDRDLRQLCLLISRR
ncbi:hypothetical protein [Mesorhizobium huakuii]|uniref:Uncharacterized protein n=1 Tax=Mesorhizobium huakuii TaxID=28104 RepID=A0A7G6SM61_9HYPH|nr:hypothetical protein [Mesorhizobium huakuii]QND55593.1 hypothetical protein HB778_02060 [Mesorhizobium huakuii]